MNAKEAKELSIRNVDVELQPVFDVIREHAERGLFYCDYVCPSHFISGYKLDRMRQLGYTVTRDAFARADRISWDR